MIRKSLQLARASKIELATLVVLLLVASLALVFGIVANEMSEGKTRAFDTAILMAMRNGGSDPVGPRWFEDAVRDITSLGSNAVLIIITAATIGFLYLSRLHGAALLVLASVGGGAVLVQALKTAFGRIRPDVVSHSLAEIARSFPSGHATMSAVTYLTLSALIARVQGTQALKVYVLAVGITLTMVVGTSRVYLGVHWPTDVLAGWCLGAAWAIACWFVAVRLQRQGRVEKAPVSRTPK